VSSRQKALLVADLTRAKKAEDIVILDMRKLSNITNFFIIATASSTRRAQSVTDNIQQGLHKARESISSIEGYRDAQWIVVDAYDVVVHIFDSSLREFYNLEGLWADAPRLRLCQKKRKKYSKKTSRKK